MLAAKLFGINDVRVVECEVPRIGDDEILVKISVAAICGTDLRMIRNGSDSMAKTGPVALGHEFSGTVASAGKNVEGYPLGAPVVIAPNFGCGHCEMCSRGDHHLCRDYQAFGINLDGGFAEYVRIPQKAMAQGNVIKLKDDAHLKESALIEPMACVYNGQERTGIEPGDTVLIVGAGPIGIMHAQLAKAKGAARILMNDLSQSRLEKASATFPYIEALHTTDLQQALEHATDGQKADVCITACASGAVQEAAFSMMALKGRILFFGGLPHGRDEIRIPSNMLHYNELKVCGSTRCNVQQCRAVAEMLESGRLALSGIITEEFRLADFNKAVDCAMAAQGLKTIVIP